MKIFLDTANLDAIRMYNDMGLVDGITTNPSLLAKEGGDPQKTMEEISRIKNNIRTFRRRIADLFFDA